jgi:hypothetical protein
MPATIDDFIQDVWNQATSTVKVEVTGTATISGTVTAAQGTAAAVSDAWPVKITDGVDTALVTASGELLVEVTTMPVQAVDQGTGGSSAWEVEGDVAHDAAGASVNPVLMGGYASAVAPSDVSATNDAVRAWFLLNGAQAVNLTAAGALIPGNATDGLLVNLGANNDVTVTGTVAVSGTVTVDTELPAAAALADDTSNPTVPAVGAFMMGMDSDGTSDWDRARLAKAHDVDSGAGTEYATGVSWRKSASGGSVEFGTSSDPVRVDPTGSTTQPVSGTVAVSSITTSVIPGTAATNLGKAVSSPRGGTDTGVQMLGIRDDTLSVFSDAENDYEPLHLTSTGRLYVSATIDDALPTGTNSIGTVQPGNTANTTPWLVTDTPATSGGLSKFHLVGAATTNATNVKASAGQVYAITAFNLNAAPRYLKFHNTAGTPTAGSGVTDTYMIPGNTAGAGVVLNIDKGIAFGTGIGITLVTGIADSDATAIAANEVVVNIYYK